MCKKYSINKYGYMYNVYILQTLIISRNEC